MRFPPEANDPANAGLHHARNFLEPIKAAHPWISYSDLWTLAGVVALKAMGGPDVEWKPGRTDFVDDSKLPPQGRLPDGEQGTAAHLRSVFHRMGFTDQEIVALSGAHNLGRGHKDRSGFSGPWVNNPIRFANTYFKILKDYKWTEKKLDNGITQFIYVDPDLSAEEAAEEEPLMMMPTDMVLIKEPAFEKWVSIYAADHERFFADFANVFSRLLELGIKRDASGKIINTDTAKGGYIPKAKL